MWSSFSGGFWAESCTHIDGPSGGLHAHTPSSGTSYGGVAAADVGRLGYANVYEAQLDTAGTVYFACQVGAHCTSGQKIAVAVE